MRVPFYGYSVIVNKYIASVEILRDVVTDKYGCRIIQLAIEVKIEATVHYVFENGLKS